MKVLDAMPGIVSFGGYLVPAIKPVVATCPEAPECEILGSERRCGFW